MCCTNSKRAVLPDPGLQPKEVLVQFFVLASLEKGSRRQEPHWVALSGLDIKGL